MRILTVRQPWAYAIIHLGKDVENRSRNIAGDYRGPVAIHAGARPLPFDDPSREFIARQTGRFPLVEHPSQLGAIIGVVDLADVHSATVLGGCGWLDHHCSEHGTCRKHCSVWAEGPNPAGGWFWHLILANPRPLPEPIPYKGALGLRTLPDEVEALIRAQLEAS